MSRSSEHDPFRSTDLIALPPIDDSVSNRWEGFRFQNDLQNSTFTLPVLEKQELALPQPTTFKIPEQDAELESIDVSSSSAYDTAEDALDTAEAEPVDRDEDIWTLLDVKNAPRTVKLYTWDAFMNESHEESSYQYISEAGADIFDAILAAEDENDPPKIAPAEAAIDALFELAMGRSSQYLRWDERHQEFMPTATRFTMSGHSPELMDELRSSLGFMGRTMRMGCSTEYFAAHTNSHLGFYSTLRSILAGLQSFVPHQRSPIVTLVQLQHVLETPRRFVECIDQFLEVVSRPVDGPVLLAEVLPTLESSSMVLPQCRTLFEMLVSALASPVLAKLKLELCGGSRLIHGYLAESHTDWFPLLPNELIRLVEECKQAEVLDGTGSNSESEHVKSLYPAHLEAGLKYSWEALSLLQNSVDRHEDMLLSGENLDNPILLHQIPDPSEPKLEPSPMVFKPIDANALTLSRSDSMQRDTDTRVAACFTSPAQPTTTYPIPYDQIIPLTLTPIITAQHRLLCYNSLQSLFTTSTLQQHLHLLHSFHLLAHGPFATRIGLALFSPSLSDSSTTRHDGSITGLRLQDRDAWPPASSELRLVLMGILGEFLPRSNEDGEAMEDTLSFALRDLDAEKLERCRDINSIYALGFLRVQYKAPTPLLEALITPAILEKYDRVFMFLLRLLRVQFVAQSLLRDITNRHRTRSTTAEKTVGKGEHRLILLLQTTISSLAAYVHGTAISIPFTAFENTVKELQAKVQKNDHAGVLRTGISITHLCDQHEVCLDSIVRALLLKEKQLKARTCVEEMMGVVLTVAATIRGRAAGDEEEAQGKERNVTMQRYHEEFNACLDRLKEVLGKEEGLPLHLLLRLSM